MGATELAIGTPKPLAGTRSYMGHAGLATGTNDVGGATATGTNGRKESSARIG